LVKAYRQFLTTPLPLTLLDSVEAAYAGLGRDSTPPVERVRSASRSLNVVVHENERRQWSDEFLRGVLESQVRRNVQILMGFVPTVLGEMVGGSFYRALSMGTLYEGLRSVRALFDHETGELVAFRDESAQYLLTVGNLRREGRTLEEVSFLVDVLRSGQIAEVAVLDSGTRASIREGLERLRGLQVLPSSSSEKIYHVFGTTDRDYEGGEVWRMSYPFPASTPSRELRRVVGVAPFMGAVDSEGRPRFALVTLEPEVPEEGVTALQLWVPVELVQGWEAGAVVRVARREE
jgi:hypothetical protein